MDVLQIFQLSWRITWRQWRLWALMLIMLVVFLVTAILSSALSGLTSVVTLPAVGNLPDWMPKLPEAPIWLWIVIALASLPGLVVTTAVTWVLQATAMRGIAIAADQGGFTLREALSLGKTRFASILKLSIAYTVIIAVLAFFPLLIWLVLPKGPGAAQFITLVKTTLSPLNTVLSIALLLMMMSVALENLKPRAAMGRAWQIFRSSWWGFLLVFALSVVGAMLPALIFVPMIVIGFLAFIYEWGLIVPAACCAVSSPVGLFVFIFTTIYTTALYTLIYRATAQLPQQTPEKSAGEKSIDVSTES